MAKIIAGFPGIGKSFLTNSSEFRASDSDSSGFSWVTENGEKVRNPEFPRNYIEHIRSIAPKMDIICVSTHSEVRDALNQANIPYTLVHPSLDCRNEYLKRYADRGSPDSFVNMMGKKFEDFVHECEGQKCGHRVVLQPGQFLRDVLGEIEDNGPDYDPTVSPVVAPPKLV